MTEVRPVSQQLPQSGKFKIYDHPVALPAKCSGCGIGHNNENRRQFIDIGISLDFYGVVYFCTECFAEIAVSLGFISVDTWTDIQELSVKVAAENGELREENVGLRSTVELLASHRCRDAIAEFANLADETEREEVGSDVRTVDEVTSTGNDESSNDDEHAASGELSDVRGDAAIDSPAEPEPVKRKPKPKSDDPFSELGL
jgi:hypothetical protein